jgi:plasmid maintenance system antidote protein VapI
MLNSTKNEITRLVRDNIDITTAIAIFAAIEIAEQYWSDTETFAYGNMAKNIILGNQVNHV